MTKEPQKSGPAAADEFQTGRVVSISAAHFIHDVYTAFLAPLLPLLIEKLSMSLTQAGLLSTVMQLPSLANPFLGLLADRISVRFFVILAPLTTAIFMSFIGLAPTYGVLLLLLLGAGVSQAAFHVPAPVMVARVAGNKVGRGMSFYMGGGEIARTLGPLAAVGAVSIFGLEGFYKVVFAGVAVTVWLYVKVRDVPAPVDAKRPNSLVETWKKTRHVLRPLIIIVCARALMHASLVTFLPTYIEQQTGDIWLAGIGLTVLEAFGVAGVLLSGTVSDRFGRRRVLTYSLMGAPVCLLLFTLGPGWVKVVALAATGLTLISTTPVMLALVQEHAGDSPSAANGLFMMSTFLARSGMTVGVGIMADIFSLQTAYIVSALIGCLALPFTRLIPDRKE